MDPYLTQDELSRHFKLSLSSLWRLRRFEGLPFMRIGTSIRYRQSDVERWLEKTQSEESRMVRNEEYTDGSLGDRHEKEKVNEG